jgi:hypothetical protein
VGDLRHNRTRLEELAAFILSREGFDPYFYCDSNGFVTIGIGTLVAKEDDARRIARDTSVHFTFQNNPRQRATVDDVAADWRRVHDRPGLHERDYRNVAKLRLDRASVNYLMRQEITRSADSLYRLHPFLLSFDSRVAMAFVDTRYNPAGINPYRSPQTKPLWAALDPNRPQFNLKTALALFESIWAGRGGRLAKRYATRHQHRVQWLREGLEAMGSTTGRLVCVPD